MPQSHPTIKCSSKKGNHRKTVFRLLPFHLQLLQSFNVLRPPGHSGELHFGAEVVERKPWKKNFHAYFIPKHVRISFTLRTLPDVKHLSSEHLPNFQSNMYIYIYVRIDYALLHFDSLPATRTKSSSLSRSLLHSHRCFLGSILERSAVESRKQIDALKNKNDSYMII